MTSGDISGEKTAAPSGSRGGNSLGRDFVESGGSFRPAEQDTLIQPTREPEEKPVTPTVVLTFSPPDYRDLCRLVQVKGAQRQVWGCPCRLGSWGDAALTVVAPALGAPYAAMVLEKLIVLGARRVLVLGWCGSLAAEVRIGSLILPTAAFPGDGTSPHYWGAPGSIPPHQGLYDLVAALLRDAGVPWHAGPVWSTDAFYRETKDLVRHCQVQGNLGIDLELAALLAVGRFRQVAVAGLLVVSDELFTLTWRPARGSEPFRQARQTALRLVLDAAAAAEAHDV